MAPYFAVGPRAPVPVLTDGPPGRSQVLASPKVYIQQAGGTTNRGGFLRPEDSGEGPTRPSPRIWGKAVGTTNAAHH